MIPKQWFFNLTATTQRLQEGADGTSINTNHLVCMWRVEKKGKGSIKGEEGNERRGSRNQERNTVAIKNWLCKSHFKEIYKNWCPQTTPKTIFFRLNQFIFLFLSPKSIIFVVQLVKTQFSKSISTCPHFFSFFF